MWRALSERRCLVGKSSRNYGEAVSAETGKGYGCERWEERNAVHYVNYDADMASGGKRKFALIIYAPVAALQPVVWTKHVNIIREVFRAAINKA